MTRVAKSSLPSRVSGASVGTAQQHTAVSRFFGRHERDARLVEEAEVGALHVEAHGGHAALLLGKVREDGLEQPLDGAGLGGEPRYARDVEVRGFGPDQEIRIGVIIAVLFFVVFLGWAAFARLDAAAIAYIRLAELLEPRLR